MSHILGVFQSIADIFTQLAQTLAFDYILYIIGGLLLLTIAIVVFAATSTYEKRAGAKLKQMNFYLKANPQITEQNLVEFNLRMKNMPKEIRTNWQQYMVNRDKKPSNFINEANCIDKPVRASRYNTLSTITLLWTTVLTLFSMLVGIGFYTNSAETFSTVIYMAFLLPVLTAIIGILLVMILKWTQRRSIGNLSENFMNFMQAIDEACKTMPKYVNYEILFTEKEIKDEIPALRVYLEQKAEIEKRISEENAEDKELEEYNFDELGLENALLLDRAMKESERYIKARNTLLDRIKRKEDEMFNYAKNFEEVTKTFEKKTQVHREAIEQLNNQINATTVAVEANYFRNRQTKEQEKLQVAESEYESARNKFEKQQDLLQREIDTYKDEVEKRKRKLEESMLAEGKSYANKIYGAMARTVREQNAPFLQKLEAEKQTLMDQVSGLTTKVEETESELASKTAELNRLEDTYKIKAAEIEAMQNVKDYFTSAEFIENLNNVKERENKAEKLKEENESVKQQIAQLEREKAEVQSQIMRERETVIKQAEQMASSKEKGRLSESDIKNRLSELEVKEKEIIEKTEQLKDNASKLQDTVGMLYELKEELFEKERAIEIKEAELRELTVKLQQTKSDVVNTQKELDASKKDLERTEMLSEERKERLKKLRMLTEGLEKENMELDKKQRELKTSLTTSIHQVGDTVSKASTNKKKEAEKESVKKKAPIAAGTQNKEASPKKTRGGAKINNSLTSLLEKASKKDK